MENLQIFSSQEFGEIRTITENGKTLFCGSDIAKALGYKRPNDAITAHCRGTVKRRTPHPQSSEKTIEMLFIPEGDIYRLAAGSELPGADKFESWIFDEVLPSIRKHGMYAVDDLLNDPDLAIKAFTALKEERKKNATLRAENETQRQLIADYTPRMEYLDSILSSVGTLTTSQIAADYGMSAIRLNQILHDEGIQHCVNGQWILYRRHMGKGYTKSETIHFLRSSGMPDAKLNTRWTQKGRLLIHEILTKRGIQAAMDKE